MFDSKSSGPQQPPALYPVYLRLHHVPCVVIGGGIVATRKVHKLLVSGADVTVISPSLSPGLQGLVTAQRISHFARVYQTADLASAKLVYAATNDRAVNAQISADAQTLGVFTNTVDSADECTFMVPAESTFDHLSIAVSTTGHDPRAAKRLAQLLREDLVHGTRTFQDAILNLTGFAEP